MRKNFMLFLMLLITVVFITSCQSKPKEVSYEPIKLDFELEEGQSETACYFGEERMIFSIGERNGNPEGPLVDTVSLILYDHVNEKIVKEFQVNSDAYICSAIPYKDGILYIDYEGVFEDVIWKLIFLNDKGKKIVAEGLCSSYRHTPVLQFIDETPVFFWENKEGQIITCGLSKIVDGKIANVFEREKIGEGASRFTTNGQKYFFVEGEDYGIFVIGDMSGIKYEYALDKKIVSIAITRDYIVCSLGEDEKYSILKVKLKRGEGEETDMEKPLYRLEGIGESTCFGVYYDFESFQLNLKNDELSEIPYPEDLQGSTSPRVYFGVSKDKCIAVFSPHDSKTDAYYLMAVS